MGFNIHIVGLNQFCFVERMSVKMRPGLKFKFKKLISVLVCVMMVAATFPFHVLNSAVFADEDGAEIHISQNNLS